MSVVQVTASPLLAAPATPAGAVINAESVRAVRAQALAHRERFTADREAHLAGRKASRAVGVEAGGWAQMVVGVGAHLGLALRTRAGRTGLVAVAGVEGHSGGFGAMAHAGVVRARSFEPGAEPLLAVEKRHESAGAAAGFGAARPGGHGLDSQGRPSTTVESMLVGIGVRVPSGDSIRLSLNLPISLTWKSREVRNAERGLKLVDRALRLLDDGGRSGDLGQLLLATRIVSELPRLESDSDARHAAHLHDRGIARWGLDVSLGNSSAVRPTL